MDSVRFRFSQIQHDAIDRAQLTLHGTLFQILMVC